MRKEYYASLDAVQALIPAGVWKNEDDPVGYFCQMPDGSEGVNWYGARTAGGLSRADQETASRVVSKYLKDRGFIVHIIRDSIPTIATTGFRDNHLSIGLQTGDLATTITGYSRCAPDPDSKYH